MDMHVHACPSFLPHPSSSPPPVFFSLVSFSTSFHPAASVDYNMQPISIQLLPTDQALLSATYKLPVRDRLRQPLPASPPFCANFSIIDDDIAESEVSKVLRLNISHGNSLITFAPPLAATVTIEDDDST